VSPSSEVKVSLNTKPQLDVSGGGGTVTVRILHDAQVTVSPDEITFQGRVVQVDPIKPELRLPGTKRLKLKYDGPLSKFAFKFNLRRSTKAATTIRRGCSR